MKKDFLKIRTLPIVLNGVCLLTSNSKTNNVVKIITGDGNKQVVRKQGMFAVELNQPTKEELKMQTIILQLNSEQYNLLKDIVEDYLNEVSNIVFIAPSDKLAKKRLKQLEDLRKIIF